MTKEEYISKNLNDSFRLWLGRAALWGCVLFLLLGALDRVVTPENFERFLVYRIVIAVLLLGSYPLTRRLSDKLLYPLTLFMVVASAATIELMILRFGGHESPYYAGIILLGISVTGFIPGRIPFHVLMAASIYLAYLLPLLFRDPHAGHADFLIANIFIILIFATMLLVRFLNGRALIADLALRYERDRYRMILEEAVAERTAELAGAIEDLRKEMNERQRAEDERTRLQGQFLQSQKMESIGRLAGGVAHDFNNILTAIMSYAELGLMKLPENDPVHAHMQAIREASEKAAGLAHQLLAFSRKQALQMQSVDLNAVVEGMAKLLRRIIGEDVELVIRTSREAEPAAADKGQIEQVLLNLAVNARDAMPSGGRLVIETAPVPDAALAPGGAERSAGGGFVMVSVTDTGKGMPTEVRERMFEPFFTTKEQGKGTGLGLSTVYGIVRQHEGHIVVDSEPGKGTTVRVYLPAASGATIVPLAEGSQAMPRGTETVLVVEDDETIRGLIREILDPLGYRVHITPSGEDACDRFGASTEPIHLLLTDVIMPGMNGKELAERLQRRQPGMKVLFMSGYLSDALIDQGLVGSGAALIHKPIGPVNLAAHVRRVLDSAP